jgi:hypothetical protein
MYSNHEVLSTSRFHHFFGGTAMKLTDSARRAPVATVISVVVLCLIAAISISVVVVGTGLYGLGQTAYVAITR